MELSIAPRELTGSVALSDVAAGYLAAMPLTGVDRERLLAQVTARADARGMAAEDPGAALHLLHEVLAERELMDPDPACASARRRLELAFGAPSIAEVVGVDLKGRERLVSTPPLSRTPMAPHRWSFWAHFRRDKGGQPEPSTTNLVHQAEKQPWQRAASIRRVALGGIVIAQTWLATTFLASILPYQGRHRSSSRCSRCSRCCSAGSPPASGRRSRASSCCARRRSLRHLATLSEAAATAPLPDDVRTAIVMPICNEDVRRVFAGLRATYESLARTGGRRAFRLLRAERLVAIPTRAWRETPGLARALPRRRRLRPRSSIAGASTASSARAATSPTSAAAGAATTATWSCSTPTA